MLVARYNSEEELRNSVGKLFHYSGEGYKPTGKLKVEGPKPHKIEFKAVVTLKNGILTGVE